MNRSRRRGRKDVRVAEFVGIASPGYSLSDLRMARMSSSRGLAGRERRLFFSTFFDSSARSTKKQAMWLSRRQQALLVGLGFIGEGLTCMSFRVQVVLLNLLSPHRNIFLQNCTGVSSPYNHCKPSEDFIEPICCA